MKLYIYAAIFFTAVSLFTWIWQDRYDAGYNAASVEMLESTAIAVEAARKAEQLKQEKVNAALQKRFNDLNVINGRLNISLDRLRNRPSRIKLSETAKANCTGVTGAELSAEDGQFLTRYAAKAATINSALETCYHYADAVEQEFIDVD